MKDKDGETKEKKDAFNKEIIKGATPEKKVEAKSEE